jgi:hypothetical protein
MLKLKPTGTFEINPEEKGAKAISKFTVIGKAFKIKIRFDFSIMCWILEIKILGFIKTEININEFVEIFRQKGVRNLTKLD